MPLSSQTDHTHTTVIPFVRSWLVPGYDLSPDVAELYYSFLFFAHSPAPSSRTPFFPGPAIHPTLSRHTRLRVKCKNEFLPPAHLDSAWAERLPRCNALRVDEQVNEAGRWESGCETNRSLLPPSLGSPPAKEYYSSKNKNEHALGSRHST